jgi:hypothetical protein
VWITAAHDVVQAQQVAPLATAADVDATASSWRRAHLDPIRAGPALEKAVRKVGRRASGRCEERFTLG